MKNSSEAVERRILLCENLIFGVPGILSRIKYRRSGVSSDFLEAIFAGQKAWKGKNIDDDWPGDVTAHDDVIIRLNMGRKTKRCLLRVRTRGMQMSIAARSAWNSSDPGPSSRETYCNRFPRSPLASINCHFSFFARATIKMIKAATIAPQTRCSKRGLPVTICTILPILSTRLDQSQK